MRMPRRFYKQSFTGAILRWKYYLKLVRIPNGVFPEHPATPMSAAVHMHLEAPEEETRRILCYLVKAGANPEVTDLKCNPLGDAFSVIPELKNRVI